MSGVAVHGTRCSGPGRLLCQGEATDCRILNILLQGAMIRPEKLFKGGPEVILYAGRFGQFAGSIVWQDSERFWIEFLEEPEHIVRGFGDAVLQVAASEALGRGLINEVNI